MASRTTAGRTSVPLSDKKKVVDTTFFLSDNGTEVRYAQEVGCAAEGLDERGVPSAAEPSEHTCDR